MAKNLFSFGKLLKSLGIEIKGAEKMCETNGSTRFLLKLKDGRTGAYERFKMGKDDLSQVIKVGNQEIKMNTTFTDSLALGELAPRMRSIVTARNNGQLTHVINYVRHPLKSKSYIHNGKFKEKITGIAEELHADKRMGFIRIPTDRLVGADGRLLETYKRPASQWNLCRNTAIKANLSI